MYTQHLPMIYDETGLVYELLENLGQYSSCIVNHRKVFPQMSYTFYGTLITCL